MNDKVTPSQLAAGLRTIQAVAEAIREVGEVPSGHLYAAVMSVVARMGEEAAMTEGTVKKGGQNPPNTSSRRPAPPMGSNGKQLRKAKEKAGK